VYSTGDGGSFPKRVDWIVVGNGWIRVGGSKRPELDAQADG
jgi:hypothetical protein